jgi:MFS family permease
MSASIRISSLPNSLPTGLAGHGESSGHAGKDLGTAVHGERVTAGLRARAVRPYSGRRRWRGVGSTTTYALLCVTLLMVSLDNTVLNVALPTLVRDLHATTTELQWIVDAYVLVFAGLLLAARASMGIGGAIMMPSTLSLLTSIFTDTAERQRAVGLWAGTTGLGVALGPIVGGALLAPVRGWTSTRVLAAGTGGLAVLALFTLWENRTAHPMLNLAFFRHRAFTGAVCSMTMVTFGLYGMLFLLTQFLRFSLGYSGWWWSYPHRCVSYTV